MTLKAAQFKTQTRQDVMNAIPPALIAVPSDEDGNPPFRAGTYFQNGRLFIATSISVLVLGRWPRLLAWRYHAKFYQTSPHYRITEGDGVKRFHWHNIDRHPDPDQMKLCVKFDQVVRGEQWGRMVDVAEIDAMRAYLVAVPKPVLDRVAACDERVYWNFLRLLSHPWGRELANANPALAFALSNDCKNRLRGSCWPYREAIAQVHRPQGEIVGWLGLPGGDCTARILRKISTSTLVLYFIPGLRCALLNKTLSKWLAHLPAVTEQVLWLVTEPSISPLLSSALLHDVVRCERGSDEEREMVLEVFRSLSFLRQRVDLPRTFRSVRSVIKAAREFRVVTPNDPAGYNKRLFHDETPYPPPPFPGNDEIHAVTSPRELAEEAAEMGHCVANYHAHVREGGIYIYRVLAPERATLTVVKRRGRWYFGEIGLAHNAAAAPETVCAAYRWLCNVQDDRAIQTVAWRPNRPVTISVHGD